MDTQGSSASRYKSLYNVVLKITNPGVADAKCDACTEYCMRYQVNTHWRSDLILKDVLIIIYKYNNMY